MKNTCKKQAIEYAFVYPLPNELALKAQQDRRTLFFQENFCIASEEARHKSLKPRKPALT